MRRLFLLLTWLWLPLACNGGPNSADNDQVTNRGAGKDQWWEALPREAWAAFPRVEQSQEWFEVYLVAPGVHAIYEPGQFEEVISYLITGTDRALLFDTGLGIADMKKLTSELTDSPVTVLNSHTHYDHIGGNHQFDTIFGMNTGYTHARAMGLAHTEVSKAVGRGWIWKTTPGNFDPGTYSIKPFRIEQWLSEGQQIDLGGRILEVIFTPGHAPDALCLIDRKNRILFTGDTFYPAPLYTHLEGSDFDAYVDTARRLAGLSADVDWLMPGHNEPAVSSAYLPQLQIAFEQIVAGQGAYVVTDGNREYAYEGFSIITR